MNMSDGGPFRLDEYASLSSVLPLITPMSNTPTPMFCPPVSLPLPCRSHHCTVKFIVIPPFRLANCAHYLLSVLNC